MTSEIVSITDVLRARRFLAGHLPETPVQRHPGLDEVCGAAIHLKQEGHQPTGAFKVRGGLNLVRSVNATDRDRGLVTSSTGNHAQSLAYAGRHFDVPVTVVMPAAANPSKAAAVRALGAELVLHGDTLEDSLRRAAELAVQRDSRLVDPGNEPLLIAGVGTAALELFLAAPDLDVLLVPVGSGTGAAGAALVAAAIAPHCAVIGVQSEQSPAAYESWHSRSLVSRPNTTRAEGLATGIGFDLPQRLLRQNLADFVTVTDDALGVAQQVLLRRAHTLTELAGAAPLAAVLSDLGRYAGRQVGLMCSGSNASLAEIVSACAREASPDERDRAERRQFGLDAGEGAKERDVRAI